MLHPQAVEQVIDVRSPRHSRTIAGAYGRRLKRRIHTQKGQNVRDHAVEVSAEVIIDNDLDLLSGKLVKVASDLFYIAAEFDVQPGIAPQFTRGGEVLAEQRAERLAGRTIRHSM